MTQEKPKDTKKKKNSCLVWGFGCLGLSILIISLALNGVLAMVFLSSSLTSGNFEKSQKPFNERIIDGDPESSNKILVVHLSGVLVHESFGGGILSSTNPSAEEIAKQIKQAKGDMNVRAVILSVDSPGGSNSASDFLYHEIQSLKDYNIPIVAYFGETAASGAYYASLPADKIYASPTSIVGSIGVVMSYLNYEELFNKVGLKEETFKAGEYKDIFSSSRDITEEEREIGQGLIDDAMARFRALVLRHRDITEEDQSVVFESRIFTSKEALDYGLIDEVGYFENSVGAASELAGIDNYQLIDYEAEMGFSELLRSFTLKGQGFDILSGLRRETFFDYPRLYYLWK